ncbi:glycoside hydrolase family 23 protein [Calocera viscosa TUFC12733]|uniref:Glycoside hydrolase family 23 protein n=1 Tax=Calocera viscosa (strain TUFC12733) TaxID=1330018 RepID=A0A167Q640_CALVF|nr:glycoside hydrolase family 23 protein [Calocera viscosa TUFC12733]
MRLSLLAPVLLLAPAPAHALPWPLLSSIRTHLLAPFAPPTALLPQPPLSPPLSPSADPLAPQGQGHHILHLSPSPPAHKRLKRRLRKRSGTRAQCTLQGPSGTTPHTGHGSGSGSSGAGSGAANTSGSSSTNTTSPSPASTASTASPNSPTITVPNTSSCSGPDPSVQVTTSGGPNGQESWMNCGISSSGGWSPPFVGMQDVVTVDLDTAMSTVGTPFAACSEWTDVFESVGDQYGIPPIILASIALQESSCQPNSIGAGGTAGLMQISQDKCAGAPGGNCLDPTFNIGAGAKYLADTVQQTGGNFLLALGYYNGWYLGMTVDKVLAVGQTACCGCMQNLDYLQQSLNGWFVGKDAYAIGLGSWQNLAVCQ